MKTKLPLRIDKYLHSIRYFKTRSIATQACQRNAVKLNGAPVKASRDVLPGDKIELRKGALWFDLEVIAIPPNRVGAKQVGLYVVDNTPKDRIEEIQQRSKDQNYYRERGEGRPTKKDRRDLDDFLGEKDD